MKYLSICSGIEAASVAWHQLGWKPVGFSEIEPFPSAVLAHHYPDVPNFGDMTKFEEWDFGAATDRLDLLVGGTPCQAFSVAGLRKGLDDERGNLSLTFCELANHFDPEWIVWENVPGVLSSKDNAFGCFLAGLCGESEPLVPDGKWDNAGLVVGPKRTVAWRILDAQYTGVAQRRRRVFVCAVRGSGNWACASALFPVGESLFWNSAPSREAGERPAATLTNGFGERGVDADQIANGNCAIETNWPAEIAPTLNAAFASKLGLENQHVRGGLDSSSLAKCLVTKTRIDAETETLIPTIGGVFDVAQPIAFSSKDYGNDASSDLSPTLRSLGAYGANGGGQMAVAQPYSIMPMNSGKDYKARETDIAQPIMAGGPVGGNQGGDFLVQSMAVRRLTPVECERLQGFPDNYTNIPWRKSPESPDGPRYKALGNSMAVPCMRWIGERINRIRLMTVAA